MLAQLWTVNGLAVELGMDRRSVARRLEGLEPDQQKGRHRRYLMRRVVAHFLAQERAGETLDLTRERARQHKEQADKLELENRTRRGELVEVAEVAAHWAKLAGEARARLLSLPTKAAPLVTGVRRIPEAQAIIETAIHDALGAIADGGPGVPRRAQAAAAADGERVGRPKPKAQPRKRRRARGVED